jgi:hypothetical protein
MRSWRWPSAVWAEAASSSRSLSAAMAASRVSWAASSWPSTSSRDGCAPGRPSGVRSAHVGLKRRQSRSATSGPDSSRVERSSASRSARIESVSCSDSRTTRRCDSSVRRSGALGGRRRLGNTERQSTRSPWSGR